jgi:hypothetical protein
METKPDTLNIKVPVMAELAAEGKQAEYLFWVGCAGAFEERYR